MEVFDSFYIYFFFKTSLEIDHFSLPLPVLLEIPLYIVCIIVKLYNTELELQMT